MPNVLVLMYGHFRSFSRTYESWSSAFEGCNVVFKCTTFNCIDHSTSCWHRKKAIESKNLDENEQNLVKKFDSNASFINQNFSIEEQEDLYCSTPIKSFRMRFENLRKMLTEVELNKFDFIVVGRYDVEIKKTMKFKSHVQQIDEINILARKDNTFFKEIAACDIIYAFHPKNASAFDQDPRDLYLKHLKYPEECMSDFFYYSFKNVNQKWNYNEHAEIIRYNM